MGFFNKLFKRDDTATAVTQRTTNFSELLYGMSSSSSRQEVNNDWQAIAIPTVARCLQVLSEGVANLPFRFMKLEGKIYKEFQTNELHYLLTVQPNPNMSAYTFKSLMVQQMYHGNGNAYVYPRFDESGQMELILLNPMSVVHDTVNNIYMVNDPENGVVGTFTENEIIHLFRFSFDGKTGVSVIKYAKRAMNIAATGDAETYNRFVTGGNVRGFITNDKGVTGWGEYQDKELKKIAENIDRLVNGDGVRIASLPGDTDFKQISLSSTDMQFLESRKFSVAELCRIYGVSPNFVFQDNSNYKSAEMAQKAFLTNTLNPLLIRIENEFTRKLVTRSMCCKRIFQFDRRELYSCDMEALSNYQLKTIQAGIYSVNDWRIKENQEPIAGGDRVLVSTNLAPIDSAKLTGEQQQKQQPPQE